MAVLTVGFEWDDASMNLHHNELAKNPQSTKLNIDPTNFNDSTVCISYLFNFKSNKKNQNIKGFYKINLLHKLRVFSVKKKLLYEYISLFSKMKDILC